MTTDLMSKSSMWGDTPGQMRDLYKSEYTFWGKRGEVVSEHPKGKVFIRGFVPDEFIPEDGGTFKMFHHQAGGAQKFGQIRLENCTNVVIEDEVIYFEDEQSVGKYVLVVSECSN